MNLKHSSFRHSSGKLHHLDPLFLDLHSLHENIIDYHIPTFDEVVLSDHAPVILDLEIAQ